MGKLFPIMTVFRENIHASKQLGDGKELTSNSKSILAV